uniref:Uncharacterized protein n=1 Tax=Oryza rufipogon TaxID=4529 RepID=A0A0E0NG24_ORYRU
MLRQWCSRANDGTRAPLGRLFLEESRGSFDRWSSSTYVVVVFRGGVRRGRPGRRAAGELLSLDSRRRPRLGLGLPTPAQEERLNGFHGARARRRPQPQRRQGEVHVPPHPAASSKENDVDHFKPKPKPTPASGRKTVQVAAAAEIDTVAAMHRIAYSAKCPSFEVLLADGALRAVRQVRSGGLHRRERVDGRRRHGRWPRPVVLG